ncbi:DUF859 family phage minor structural protein [Exiguobacterium aurantiacum]|uniref:DUF859 family phage minor structural protein n=1 Tax=Exiguobacterium aurantiacum TaxID=33987 RepID=UPI00384D1920
MASSGTQTIYGGPSDKFYVQTTWSQKSQSTSENRTLINVKVYIGAASGWSANISTNSFSVAVTGQTTQSGSNRSININGSKQLLLDEDFLIYHDADGTKSVTINPYFTGSYIGTIDPAGFTANLNTIPRASTLAYASTSNLVAGTDKAISINRSSSSFYHTVRIYVTKGTEELLLRTESFNASTTSKTVSWDNTEIAAFWSKGHGYYTGTKMIVTTYLSGDAIGTSVQEGTLTYPSNNTVGSLSGNIDVGQSFMVSLSKASSLYSHEAQIRLPDGTVVASQGLTSSSSFSMTPTASLIYPKTTTTQSINAELWIRTVLTADTSRQIFTWTKDDTKSIRIVNSEPTLGATLTYKDSSTTIVGYTGNDQLIVPTKSIPQVTFSAATERNSATIVEYVVSLDGQTKKTTAAGTVTFDPIQAQGNTLATLTVRDSRGFTSSRTIVLSVVQYMNPSLNIDVYRADGFGNLITIKSNGMLSPVNNTNNVTVTTALRFRYKLKSTATFPDSWTNIGKATATSSAFTGSDYTVSLPNTNAYDFEVMVTDRYGGSTSAFAEVGTGTPLMFLDTTKLSMGVNMFPTLSNAFQVSGSTQLNGTLEVTGNATLSGTVSSGELTASSITSTGAVNGVLNHTSGYFGINSFDTGTYGSGKGEIWYRADMRRFAFSSRNTGDTSAQTAALLVDQVNTKVIQASTTGSHNYLQTGASWEWQVTANGTTDSYRPIRASSHLTGSSINYKTNLEDIGTRVNALELIKETDIWHYHLKSNLEGGIYDKPKVGVIAEMVNPLIRDEDGVDPYTMVSLAWKAIQQQDEKIQAQQAEIEDLKEMLMLMNERLTALES